MKEHYSAADHTLVRELNLSTVLQLIHAESPISRARLAHLTGLNKSTISSLVEDLISRKLILESGLSSCGAGRPSTTLELDPAAGQLIGIEIGVDFISTILTNFTGNITWRNLINTTSFLSQDAVIELALQQAIQAMNFSRSGSARLLGMGLTSPGMVSIDSGVLRYSPNLQWRDVPLAQLFFQQMLLPIIVDNDANAAAVGEHLFGSARDAHDFLFILLGIGIGGGLFLNGELYRGFGGLAGEIGHISILADQNRLCRCGNRGCWENYGNQYALIERMQARLDIGRRSIVKELAALHGGSITLEMIRQAADAGDEETLDILHETGIAIGQGVANLINIFNPQTVIIGGSLSLVAAYLLPAILSIVNERTLSDVRSQASVQLSAFGADAVVMGAVAMVVAEIFSHPTRVEPLTLIPGGRTSVLDELGVTTG